MIIDPHIHMVSRTTDDYAALALHGIRVISEPSFWPGYDRKTPLTSGIISSTSRRSNRRGQENTASATIAGSA